jgi:hypothetical protein
VADDSFAALEHLRGRPDVDPARIGVMGFSWGASAALRTSSARYRRDAPGRGFRAAVAFYPMCVSPRPDWPAVAQERAHNLFEDVEAPTLVLMGAADDDTPNVAQNCATKVAALRRAGRPVDIILYPGAGHVFDSRDSENTRAAGADMLAFFRRHLAAPAGRGAPRTGQLQMRDDRDETLMDRVGREPERFEREGSEERRASRRARHERGGALPAVESQPDLSEGIDDAFAARELGVPVLDRAKSKTGDDLGGQERVQGAGVDEQVEADGSFAMIGMQ